MSELYAALKTVCNPRFRSAIPLAVTAVATVGVGAGIAAIAGVGVGVAAVALKHHVTKKKADKSAKEKQHKRSYEEGPASVSPSASRKAGSNKPASPMRRQGKNSFPGAQEAFEKRETSPAKPSLAKTSSEIPLVLEEGRAADAKLYAPSMAASALESLTAAPKTALGAIQTPVVTASAFGREFSEKSYESSLLAEDLEKNLADLPAEGGVFSGARPPLIYDAHCICTHMDHCVTRTFSGRFPDLPRNLGPPFFLLLRGEKLCRNQ